MPRPSGMRQSPARARSSGVSAVDPAASDHDIACAGRVQAGDDGHEGALARAVGPQHGHDPSRGNLEIDAVEDLDGAIGGSKA